MNLRILTAGLSLAAATLFTIGLGANPADAQQPRSSVLSRNAVSPNSSYQQGPRTRIFVSKRSWLDLGTEVKPGDRKYTDYAIPPGYNAPDQITGRSFSRQPFVDPWDLPGYPKGGYSY